MTSSRFSFLRRVRIHDEECGAVARALHHEVKIHSLPAALGKVSMATLERKVMSNQTFFRRIALTAIAALSFGMLSSIPSQAVISGEDLTIGATSTLATGTSYEVAAAIGDTATATIKHSFNLTGATDSVVVSVVGNSVNHGGTVRFTVTDSSTSRGGNALDPRYNNPSSLADYWSTLSSSESASVPTFSVTDSGTTTLRSVSSTISLRVIGITTAGTYTFTVATELHQQSAGPASYSVTAGKSVTFKVVVAADDKVATAASTSTLREGYALRAAGVAENSDSTVVGSSSTAGTTAAATIWVEQKNAAGTADESMTVSVAGPAFVSAESATTGRVTSGSAVTMRNKGPVGAPSYYGNQTPIFVWSTGTAGEATITITTLSGLVIGTEKVKFAGNVAKISLDYTERKVLKAGGSSLSDQPTIGIYAEDAAGMPVTGLTFSMVSSNTQAVSSATTGACTGTAGAPGYYDCVASVPAAATSGLSATLTYRTTKPLVTPTDYFTVTHDVTLGGAVSTWTLSADKASYSPGEAMVLTAKGVDASGNQAHDGAAGPTFLVSNKSLGGTSLSTVMNKVIDGVSTSQIRSDLDSRIFRNSNTLFAPNASGEFTISGVYGTDNAKSVSLKLTVGDDAATAAAAAATDAALEAIDAANAATDAANLAAEAADAATVAAEEARDAADAATAAVEALATEVATLMAALKAQITTLANTVAKIAKRVRA